MEVHAHTHTPRKKWTHYLWEFIMLFLAVFCGFLAEYQLEQKIENERERQYMTSMIDNLKNDTAEVKNIINIYESKIKWLDSLLSIRYSDFSVRKNQERYYNYCIKIFFNNAAFQSNDATLIQLRNSGGLRLIRAKGVADSITTYQQEMEGTQSQYLVTDRYFNKSNTLLEKIVDETILFDTAYYSKGRFSDKAMLSINDDTQLLKEFFNTIQVYKLIARSYLNYNLKYDLEYGERLISFIDKKYHLK